MVDFPYEADPRFTLRLLVEDAVDLMRWSVYDDRTGRAIIREARSVGGRSPVPANIRGSFSNAIDELDKRQVAAVLEQLDAPEGPMLLDLSGWSGKQLDLKLRVFDEPREAARRHIMERPDHAMADTLYVSALRDYAAIFRGLTTFAGAAAILALFELLLAFAERAEGDKPQWSTGDMPTAY